MNKSEIERIALEVAADIPVLGSPGFKHYIGQYEAIQLCSRFLAAIDAERGKEAVTHGVFVAGKCVSVSQHKSHMCVGGMPVTSRPLFLSPTPIPDGYVLVPIETLKLFPELRAMIAAAQGEK